MSYGFGDGLYDEAVGPRPHRIRVMSGVLVTAGRDSRSTAEKMIDVVAERVASSTPTKLVECWCGSALRDVPAAAAAAKFRCSERCMEIAGRAAADPWAALRARCAPRRSSRGSHVEAMVIPSTATSEPADGWPPPPGVTVGAVEYLRQRHRRTRAVATRGADADGNPWGRR